MRKSSGTESTRGWRWIFNYNDKHNEDSPQHIASNRLAGAGLALALSTSAQHCSRHLCRLRGGVQPKSAYLPPLRSALSDHPFTGGQPIGLCAPVGAEVVPDMHRIFTRGGQRPRPLTDSNWHTGSDSPLEISESTPTVPARRGPAGQRLSPRRQNLGAPARAGANPYPMAPPGKSRL